MDETFRDRTRWVQKSILSTAGMGKFSTDRTYVLYVVLVYVCQPVAAHVLCGRGWWRLRLTRRLSLPMPVSSSIQEYADEIWGIVPTRRPHPTEEERAGAGVGVSMGGCGMDLASSSGG